MPLRSAAYWLTSNDLLSFPFIDCRITSTRMALLSMVWAILHWTVIEKMPHYWISWRHFLSWGSYLCDVSNLVSNHPKPTHAHGITSYSKTRHSPSYQGPIRQPFKMKRIPEQVNEPKTPYTHTPTFRCPTKIPRYVTLSLYAENLV